MLAQVDEFNQICIYIDAFQLDVLMRLVEIFCLIE